jgi:hypothetical protein
MISQLQNLLIGGRLRQTVVTARNALFLLA